MPESISTTINSIQIENCRIKQIDGPLAIAFDHIKKLAIVNNKVSYDKNSISGLINEAKSVMGMQIWPMIITDCNSTMIKRNKGLKSHVI